MSVTNYPTLAKAAAPVFVEILAERFRQEQLCAEGKFPWTPAHADKFVAPEGLAVLGEEFGEIARVVCEGVITGAVDTAHLREELIQLAACCVAWVEGIDKQEAEDEAAALGETGYDVHAYTDEEIAERAAVLGPQKMTTQKLTVKVTQEHIDLGVREDSNSCAVALALKEQVEDVDSVNVDPDTIYIWLEDGSELYGGSPGVAAAFIEAFDGHQPVDPFEFEIELEVYYPDDCDHLDEDDEDGRDV